MKKRVGRVRKRVGEFFVQAEDGKREVTRVETYAIPINVKGVLVREGAEGRRRRRRYT